MLPATDDYTARSAFPDQSTDSSTVPIPPRQPQTTLPYRKNRFIVSPIPTHEHSLTDDFGDAGRSSNKVKRLVRYMTKRRPPPAARSLPLHPPSLSLGASCRDPFYPTGATTASRRGSVERLVHSAQRSYRSWSRAGCRSPLPPPHAAAVAASTSAEHVDA